MAVIGTYPIGSDWVEVHCSEGPDDRGRLTVRRFDVLGRPWGCVSDEYDHYAWALFAAQRMVLARGGQLGQAACAVAGGRVDARTTRQLLASRNPMRWAHVRLNHEPGAGA